MKKIIATLLFSAIATARGIQKDKVMHFVAGVGKELIDSRKGGTGFNNQDIIATGIGGFIVGVTINLF
jgi:uncharacterized protein YfiM (DUF2279 family)